MHFKDIHDLDPTRAHRVFDVDGFRIAKTYAKALLNAALKADLKQVDAMQESFDSLVGNPLAQDPEQNNAARLLAHGDIPRSKRKAAIKRALSGKAEEMFINFLIVLDKHGRLHILRAVAAMYREVRDEFHKRVRVVVRTAEPLTDGHKAALKTLAENTLKLQPVLVEIIDPELLGGMQVQVGDKLIDLSVRGRLDAIKNQLIERGTHEIQRREIVSVLQSEIESYREQVESREVGKVLEVGDGIARVYGLSNVMSGELVEFTRAGVRGLAFNLEENSVGIIILGDFLGIEEGDEVRTTGELLSVPVGDALVGRVVDPLGNPMDGKGPIVTDKTRPLESTAPGVVERQPVKTPLQTGIKAIDAMTPVGRGQRELIIGDRKTGKTTIAVDTILNQKTERVICVYVAIGQKESTVAQTVEYLRKYGAMDYTIVVVASASVAAPMQYIAPYAGTAMAEYFMYEQGRDTLCVYDDLTKQASAYRQLSLLMRRPPGREAYPGDVFYCHSRLLERSARAADRYVIVPGNVKADDKITDDWGVNDAASSKEPRKTGGPCRSYMGPKGREEAEKDLPDLTKKLPQNLKIAKVWNSGGSLTALPIIETLEGEVSAYIPTNVISITDGQIYLQPDLFFAGVRPAVDVGISVSRVGGNAQIGAMKQVAGSLRLDLSAFRSLEAFAQLGTELDKASQQQLDRGYRMVEILKQPAFSPMNVIDQVLVLYAGSNGYLDKVPVKQVPAWQEQFVAFMLEQKSEVHKKLETERKLSKELEETLKAALVEFGTQFKVK